ncbi:MarR family winged helix-turn-helix transcriptional regulator [Curtobacterium sp. B8]|uniref:MarR family winged helix-turn-helix transcriptional regulator n=1 Tax=Curtobacterium sp. B8 TaxID=95611 RepID=UPI00034DC6B3|nr:MarR family transcriptional regulator [Curtobacterium sp. B8]
MPREFSATRDDVDAIAAWTVIRAARTLARRLGEVLAPLGLSPVEFGALVQLAAGERLTQAELARAVGIRPQSVTTLVAALADRGLLNRGPERGRGRPSRITLTSTGRALLAEAFPVVLASNSWFAGDAEPLSAILAPFVGDATGPADVVP